MQHLVVGVDGPGFVAGVLDEAHWSYMDRYADRLVARGPTLSPDGEGHTGSLHVVDLPDLASALRFAQDEPYAAAQWYSRVSVQRVVPCLDGTMWDRPATPAASALVIAEVGPATLGADVVAAGVRRQLSATGPWVYVAVSEDDDGLGLVALVDLAPDDARSAVVDLLDDLMGDLPLAAAEVAAQRWQRGGRPG